MARRHPGLPRAKKRFLSKNHLLEQLQRVDNDRSRREKVLRLETSFRAKIGPHIASLPANNATLQKFKTSPYVLLMHACQRGYTKISEIEADILPSKQFSSMETAAGCMVEEVVFPEYGWECVASEMHTSNSALDGKRIDENVYQIVTLKSGPSCLNDEMSEYFAKTVLENFETWAQEAEAAIIDFTYGVLYGTEKMSNKKDWHILRYIKEKLGIQPTISPDGKWFCQFVQNDITVNVTIRIGWDWWRHLGGELCFIEVFAALIRACIHPGNLDSKTYEYTISDLNKIVSTHSVPENYNVSLLQYSQIPWLFLMARHFCDQLEN